MVKQSKAGQTLQILVKDSEIVKQEGQNWKLDRGSQTSGNGYEIDAHIHLRCRSLRFHVSFLFSISRFELHGRNEVTCAFVLLGFHCSILDMYSCFIVLVAFLVCVLSF